MTSVVAIAIVVAGCAETQAPAHVPDGPMADLAPSLESVAGCEAMGKVTAKNGPNADFDMRSKAAKLGATHVYRAPMTDTSGFGVGLESHDRVYSEMYRCGSSEGGVAATDAGTRDK